VPAIVGEVVDGIGTVDAVQNPGDVTGCAVAVGQALQRAAGAVLQLQRFRPLAGVEGLAEGQTIAEISGLDSNYG